MKQLDKRRTIPIFINTILWVLLTSTGGHCKTSGDKKCSLALPARLGKVIYQEHEDRRDRIYIIAQSHRSAVTGEANEDCRKVQAEIYRIGEWLIANEKVEALLPEGYFSKSLAEGRIPNLSVRQPPQGVKLDDAALAASLADPAISLNADRLLYSTYGLALRQVEDRKLYSIVVKQLRALLDDAAQQQLTSATALPILTFQQKKRSAVILSRIPEAMAGNNKEGQGKIHRAMLTIGLAHVGNIIDFLRSGKARVQPPPGTAGTLQGFSCDLHCLEKCYAITVIIPRALNKAEKMLRFSQRPAAFLAKTEGIRGENSGQD